MAAGILGVDSHRICFIPKLERPPMKLQLIFVFGFLVSLTALSLLVWVFAAYETNNLWPLNHNPRLSQET